MIIKLNLVDHLHVESRFCNFVLKKFIFIIFIDFGPILSNLVHSCPFLHYFHFYQFLLISQTSISLILMLIKHIFITLRFIAHIFTEIPQKPGVLLLVHFPQSSGWQPSARVNLTDVGDFRENILAVIFRFRRVFFISLAHHTNVDEDANVVVGGFIKCQVVFNAEIRDDPGVQVAWVV